MDSRYQEDIKYLIGFDFGHGETSAIYVPVVESKRVKKEDVGKRNNLFIRRGTRSEQCKIPSVIHKNGTQNEAGEIEFTYSLTSKNGSPCLAFKDKISILKEEAGKERLKAFRAFIKAIYEKVLENNDFLERPTEEHPYGNFLVYIACPTSWNDAEKREYKEFFEKAMGHPVEWVINESDAAFFTHRQDGLVLVVDFGSSTIDYTLMHNHKKIDIDHTSSNLGARQVEQLMLADYKRHSKGKGSYDECKKISKPILDKWMDVDSFLLLKLREGKEISYSAEDSSVTMAYSLDWNELRINNENVYTYFCPDVDALQRAEVNAGCNDGYIPRVEENFRELRGVIEEELAQRGLDIGDMKIILSGGATMMPWIRTSLMEVFDIPEDERQTRILRDNDPSYVVANGVAKYAYAKYQILKTIVPPDFKERYHLDEEIISCYNKAFHECRLEELKKIRSHYVSNYSTYDDLFPLLEEFNFTFLRREEFFRNVNEKFNESLNAFLNQRTSNVFRANFQFDPKIQYNIIFPEFDSYSYVVSDATGEVFRRICEGQHWSVTMDKPRSESQRAKVFDLLIESEKNCRRTFILHETTLETSIELVRATISEAIENRDLFEVVR